MEDVLPNFREFDIPIKDVWIGFATKDGKDIDIRVYDTDMHRNIYEIVRNRIEPGYYLSDIGNCLSGWEKTTLSNLLFRFGFLENFDRDLRIRALKELSKVLEWKEEVEGYLSRMGIEKTYE